MAPRIRILRTREMVNTKLSGITWDHSRGFLPMAATAQRYVEMHPDLDLDWRKRTLYEFGHQSIEELANKFDLLVIDHPFVGFAAAHDVIHPLEELIAEDFLAEQASNSVGDSHRSYEYAGHQWALAIDAATPVSAFRLDLIESKGLRVPETWDDLLVLARGGHVIVAGSPVDSLMTLYAFCCAFGEEPFGTEKFFVHEETGIRALEGLRELMALVDPMSYELNPIRTYELMVATDRFAYSPIAYGYSNYAIDGYARRQLSFGGLITMPNGRHLRSTLGGTGLAISRRCAGEKLSRAADYTKFVASPPVQRSIYTRSGGQPAHLSAWHDSANNAASNNFFYATMQTMIEAYMRPRYNGYMYFQENGGAMVNEYLKDGGAARRALNGLNNLYRDSQIRT